ncbi:MAG: Hpt domain-containing protein, partial [Lachnospiraceae bacterium]|nr:Hpt domain-containing protein [Lachnospiraceae bacterium]
SADDAESFYIKKGFTDYLAKPIDPQVLENMLKKYIPAEKISLIEADTGALSKKKSEAAGEDGSDEIIMDLEEVASPMYEGDILEKVLESYMESVDENASLIKEYYEKADWENYSIKVHALKSSSRIIGEQKLGALAEKLEHAGESLDIEFIGKYTDMLLEWYKAMPSKYGFEEKEDDRPLIDDNSVKEAFSAIKELAASFDSDGIDGIIEELEKYRISDNLKEKYETIKKAARNADWNSLI